MSIDVNLNVNYSNVGSLQETRIKTPYESKINPEGVIPPANYSTSTLANLRVHIPCHAGSGAECIYSSHRYQTTGVWEIGTRCYKCGFAALEIPTKKQLECKHVPMTPEGPPKSVGWPTAVRAPIPRKCNMCRHIQGTEMTLRQQSCSHKDGYREIEMAPEVHLNGGWGIGMAAEQ